jgi:hypothetical protein
MLLAEWWQVRGYGDMLVPSRQVDGSLVNEKEEFNLCCPPQIFSRRRILPRTSRPWLIA